MTKSIIDQKEIQVTNPEGTEIRYRFKLEQADDVFTMLISAADATGKAIKLSDGDHYVGVVLRAQADMIEQGLHCHEDRGPDMVADIERFHQFFGLEWPGKPRILEPDLFNFRKIFIEEEFQEWQEEQAGLVEALTADDGEPDHRKIALGLHQQLDALVDLMYVVLGAAYLQFGRKTINEAWRRVQAANMKKERIQKVGSGLSKRGYDQFDVVKPEGWQPPDHHDLVREHAHYPKPKIQEKYLDPATAGRTGGTETA